MQWVWRDKATLSRIKINLFSALSVNETSDLNPKANLTKDSMDGLDQLWLNTRRAEGWINNTGNSLDGLDQLWLNTKRAEESNNATKQMFEVSRAFKLKSQ